jgi:hypothetical protein
MNCYLKLIITKYSNMPGQECQLFYDANHKTSNKITFSESPFTSQIILLFFLCLDTFFSMWYFSIRSHFASCEYWTEGQTVCSSDSFCYNGSFHSAHYTDCPPSNTQCLPWLYLERSGRSEKYLCLF